MFIFFIILEGFEFYVCVNGFVWRSHSSEVCLCTCAVVKKLSTNQYS